MRRRVQNSKKSGKVTMRWAVRFAVLLPALGLIFAFTKTAAAQSVQISGNVFPVSAVGQPSAQTVTLTALVDDVVIQNLTISSAGRGKEYAITDQGTCTGGSYVTAGTSCTFTITFNPLAPGYSQAPAPIGRWGQVILQYSDQLYGGSTFRSYPLTGSANGPNQVVTPGLITDIVGNDVSPHYGFGGDGGPASGAIFEQPSSIAMDTYGNLYITESGNDVVRVVYAGGGFQYLSNAVPGDIYTIAGLSPSGGVSYPGPGVDSVIATQSRLNNPTGVAVDPLGNVYIADSANNAVRMVTAFSSGYISTVAGTLNAANGYAGDGGPATSAQLANPSGVSVDGYGNIYIADNGNNVVRVVYQGGIVLANLIATENSGMAATVGNIYTIAGGPNAALPANGDGGLATQATLNAPNAVVADSSGNVYIADYINRAVRRVDAVTGYISSVASGIDYPVSLAVDSSDSIYFNGHNFCNVMQYNPSLQTGLTVPYLNTVAGNGICMASGDGNGATSAGLSGAEGLVVDGQGNLYLLEADGVRFVNAQQSFLNFGSVDVSNGAGLSAIVSDDNILPSPGAPTVIDIQNPAFQIVFAAPQNFEAGSFSSANPNIPDCDAVSPVYPSLSPGTSCGTWINFQPTTDGGPFPGSANQPYFSTTASPINISLSGSGIGTQPTVTITGNSTPFVAVLNGTPAPPETFVLTNTSNATLHIQNVTTYANSGAGVGYFSVTNTCGQAQDGEIVLGPGSSCPFILSYTALAVGSMTGYFEITDNASTDSGYQFIAISATVLAPQLVTLTPVALTFSTPENLPSATQTLTLTNTANNPVQIGSISLTGNGSNIFSETDNCGPTLLAQSFCSIQVTFNPKYVVGLPTPLYITATLSVTESADSNPVTAQLNGVGTFPINSTLKINESITVTDVPVLTRTTVLPIVETITVTDSLPALTPSPVLAIVETINLSDTPNLVPALVATTASLRYTYSAGVLSLIVGVNPSAATGIVSLYDGGSLVASGPLASSSFTYTSNSFVPGVHQFYARYGGSSTYAPSTTSTVQVIVLTVLTVTAQSTNRAFAAANPALIFLVSGFVGGDTSAVLGGTPSLATTAVLNSLSGTYPITVLQGTLSAPSYYALNFVNGTLTVDGNHPQWITFILPPTISIAKATLTLTAQSDSGLPIAYQVTGPVTFSGHGNLTLTGTGTVTVTATQPGNATFSAATPVVQTFEVTP